MKNVLDLENFDVVELNVEETKAIDGGFWKFLAGIAIMPYSPIAGAALMLMDSSSNAY
jgi:hypothetical protein